MRLKSKSVFIIILFILALVACQNKPSPPIAEEAEYLPSEYTINADMVNTKGFDCAISMTIRLLKNNNQITSCEDTTKFINNSDFTNYQNHEWLVETVNDYCATKQFNCTMKYRGEIGLTELLDEDFYQSKHINIVTIQHQVFVHALVVVAYDAEKGGLFFLDSLAGKGPTSEKDFEEYYGVKFQDVWKDTYAISEIK